MRDEQCFGRSCSSGVLSKLERRVRWRSVAGGLSLSACALLAACSSSGTDSGSNGALTPFTSPNGTETSAANGTSNTPSSTANSNSSTSNLGGASSASSSEASEGGVMPSGLAPGAGGATNSSSGANAAAGGAVGSAMAGMAGAGESAAGSASTMGAAGAAMGQAGSGAAGSGNMQPPPAVANCPANALFCDDFEDDVVGQFPGAPWQNQTGSGATVMVDGQQAFSGTKAVHVNAPPNGSYRRGYFSLIQGKGGTNIFPAVSKVMFGRAMMWLDATPNTTVHWSVIQAEGEAADGTHATYYRYGGQQQNGAGLMASYDTSNGVSTDCYAHSDMTMPTKTWTCMEWRFSSQTNELQLWINGNDVSDIHVTDHPMMSKNFGCIGDATKGEWIAPPNFTTLHLGWESYQTATNDRNLWVDDVVVSTERIGCPTP